MLAVSFPALLAFLVFMLFTEPQSTGMVTSDGGWKSPQSDGSYTSPTSDGSYESPASDNSYESPTTGPGYVAPTIDESYESPTTGPGFQTPETGSGFLRPQIGPGFLDPSLFDANVTGTNGNETTEVRDATPEKRDNLQRDNASQTNDTSGGKGERQEQKGPIDRTLIGSWRIYSESVYFKKGGYEFASPATSALNLRGDGTWAFGGAQGTWTVLPIADDDWSAWGIGKKEFTKKLVLSGWNGRETMGPIEDTSYGGKFLWAVYDAEPPEVKDSAQVWVKFAPAPAQQDEIFSESQLTGRWKLHSQGRYQDEQGQWVFESDLTRILEIREDRSWDYGPSKGTWKTAPIEDADWQRWQILPYGPTRKLILENWNEKGAEGPIEASSGQVSFFWMIQAIQYEGKPKPQWYQYKFVPLESDLVELAIEKTGSGDVSSDEGNIACGGTCAHEYAADSTVTLTAKPQQGWMFLGWGGGCQGTESTCTMALDRATTVKAEFVPGCADDSACPLDQKCQSSTCVALACECGYPGNHACQPYECCSGTQCGEGMTCSTDIHKCVAESACRAVYISGDPAEKHDIVFVGDGISDYKTLTNLVLLVMDFEGTHNGVLSTTPFRENADKFNVWMVIAPDYAYDANGEPDLDDYRRFVKTCERDTVVIMTGKTYRPFAFFPTHGPGGGVVYLSLGFLTVRGSQFAFENSGRLLLHELGHAIGGLADEYVEYGVGTRNVEQVVNCAPDLATAKKRWGDLEGVDGVHFYTGVKDVPGTTYYKSPKASIEELGTFPDGSDWSDGGCSYDWNNIRPTIGSFMNNQFEQGVDYGPVNEREMQRKLEGYG